MLAASFFVSSTICFVAGSIIDGLEVSDRAKREENNLGDEVADQAEWYATHPQSWYGLWFDKLIPLVYMANGKKIVYKNMLTDSDGEYTELSEMHSPKKMLQIIGKTSEYGALPYLQKKGLRECQYNAEIRLEAALKNGIKRNLAVLATISTPLRTEL